MNFTKIIAKFVQAKLLSKNQSALYLQPVLPQFGFIRAQGLAVVCSLQKENAIALPLQLPGRQTLYQLVKQPKVYFNLDSQRTEEMTGSLIDCQGAKIQIDLGKLMNRKSTWQKYPQRKKFFNANVMADLTHPLHTDDLQLINGNENLRFSYFNKIAKRHKGPIVFCTPRNHQALQFKTLYPKAICISPSMQPAQQILFPLVGLELSNKLAESNQEVLFFFDGYEVYKKYKDVLFRDLNIKDPFIDAAYLIYNQTLSRPTGSVTTFVGYQEDSIYKTSIQITHGIQTLAKPVKLPISLSRTVRVSPLKQNWNKLIQLQQERKSRLQVGLKADPWQQYFILDSQWWFKGLEEFDESEEQLQKFLTFLNWNIQKDTVCYWKISAVEAFKRLCLSEVRIQDVSNAKQVDQRLEKWMILAKMQNLLLQTKRDYI